jgi:hypothetical protein
MGQITIEIPTKRRRRYVVTDKRAADELISALERSAVEIKSGDLTPKEVEDLQDAADVRKALEEYRRIGKTYSWERVKKELGL